MPVQPVRAGNPLAQSVRLGRDKREQRGLVLDRLHNVALDSGHCILPLSIDRTRQQPNTRRGAGTMHRPDFALAESDTPWHREVVHGDSRQLAEGRESSRDSCACGSDIKLRRRSRSAREMASEECHFDKRHLMLLLRHFAHRMCWRNNRRGGQHSSGKARLWEDPSSLKTLYFTPWRSA